MFPILLTLKTISRAKLSGLMFLCALLAVLVVAGLGAAITGVAATLVHFKTGWLDTSFNWLAGIIIGIGGWFMLPALTVLIGGVFQETVIRRVEKTCYPETISNQRASFWMDLSHDIRFTLKALFLNLLALPLYVVGIGFPVSIALNSYLLGREFFESVAGYHMGKPEARDLGRRNPLAVYGGGFALTLISLTPIVNMFVPVIAVVWMVHVYHKIKGPGE
jgi:CysZ protein